MVKRNIDRMHPIDQMYKITLQKRDKDNPKRIKRVWLYNAGEFIQEFLDANILKMPDWIYIRLHRLSICLMNLSYEM